MRVPEMEWANEEKYGTVLYFAQLVEEMFWHGARDSYRPYSLDSYHRSVELSKTYSELKEAGVSGSMSDMFDEFLYFVSRDLTVKRNFAAAWEIVDLQLGDKSARDDLKIEAVKLFERSLRKMYLRRCRDEIEAYAGNQKPKDKKEFRALVGNYFSFLLNVGHSPEHIYFHAIRHFFERELTGPPRRELQEFFRLFPGRPSEFKVLVSVSNEMRVALDGNENITLNPTISPAVLGRHKELLRDIKPNIVEFSNIKAFDIPAAWLECSRSLNLTRALSYTAKPLSEMSWKTAMIVSSPDFEAGTQFNETASPLRRRYRGNAVEADKQINQRRLFLQRETLHDQDRNRLLNSINGYADAFHSESPATQLVSLWSSLEGFLPVPTMAGSRIQHFLKDISASQQRLYLQNQFLWLYVDLVKQYRDSLSRILDEVSDYQNEPSKLIAAICFERYKSVLSKLGALCGGSPLATQRMFELNKASKSLSDLFGIVELHLQRVRWHILRIYRERNRIVHRANPSKNVSSLIVNLNEYILVCMEAFFRTASDDDGVFSVDDIFSEIRIREGARSTAILRRGKESIGPENASLVLGYELT